MNDAHEPSEQELREIGRRWLAWLEQQLNCLSLPACARGCQHPRA
jgi:hypothetical protein